ncbi:hypothetical protein Btru_043620 [Bulinus truncatus]|nr:hypothetical protein Btru_043620 [Bulinus truncatus]
MDTRLASKLDYSAREDAIHIEPLRYQSYSACLRLPAYLHNSKKKNKTMSVVDMLTSPCLFLLSTLSTTTTFCLVVTSVVALLSYYLLRSNSTEPDNSDWSRLGVKYPNLPSSFFAGTNFRDQVVKLIQEYGDIVGLRITNRMWLLTTNLELLRFVFTKDFNNFIDRADKLNSNTPLARALFFARGNDWRRHRQIASPTFSSGKLKYISTSVEHSAKRLAEYLAEFAKDGNVVPVKDASARYSGEIIAKVAFGLDAKLVKKESSEFYEFGKNMLELSHEGLTRFILMLMHRVPKLVYTCNKLFPSVQLFEAVNLKANAYFNLALTETIEERRRKTSSGGERKQVDFLDLLLKANDNAKSGRLDADDDGADPGVDHEKTAVNYKGLSDEEVIGQSMLVIFAGLETTATTLQMCLFELAKHQDIQDKVYEEISTVLQNESPTADDLHNLHYTECVINETLRLHPPIPSINRRAKETRTYGGVTIPKGACVMIPLWHILSDPRIWPEPEKFNPERFAPEEKEKRDPMAFVCFGQGPRLCLGMRLAYLELKQALVHVLRKVKVVLNDKTEPRLGGGDVEVKKFGLLTPVKPVLLAFQLREQDGQK